MDRVFKRVAEGVLAFDGIYDKVQTSTNHSQKEKLEQDLKREIKKLQRLRDQIKTWMGSNEIKDKKALTEQRKLIETEMERFKACEKEMKTKAYSKEGLTNSGRLDPREKEKGEAAEFITTMLEELERQLETLESEQETLQATMKKGRKDNSKSDRISEIEDTLDRHKWHTSKLEIMLRMIENGTLAPESVMDLQEDIKYYVESNQDADFAEDEEIYNDLNLEDDEDFEPEPIPVKEEGNSLQDLAAELEKENASGVTNLSPVDSPVVSSVGTSLPSLSAATTATATSASTVSSAAGLIPISSATGAGAGISSPSNVASAVVAAAAVASRRVASSPSIAQGKLSVTSSGPAQLSTASASSARTATSDLKYATAAIGGSIPQGLSPLPPPKNIQPQQQLDSTSSPSPTSSSASVITAGGVRGPQPVVTVAPTSSVPWSERLDSSRQKGDHQLDDSKQQQQQQQLISARVSSPSVSGGSATSSPRPTTVSPLSPHSEQSSSVTTAGTSTSNAANAASSAITETTFPSFQLPPGLQDLVHALDSARRRIGSPAPISTIGRLLETSFLNCPDSLIADRPRYYHPESPFPTPAYYPQEPLTNLDSPSVIAKMDLDTLFYIFYYRQGTYQQYLAAKELKNRSWRFHKLFLTWFQRHEEPKVISSEFEQGTYRFFDFEGSWMQRRKANFKFEYQYLEDEI